ncbi:MAG: LON peptidase substrate-binding domain-containing protein [Kofleriaceae bacterium]
MSDLDAAVPPEDDQATDGACPEEAIDAAALTRLAIFPLPNAVLLPGGLMPLHVFEDRYRDMVRDCLDGSRLLAIARLRPGYQTDYQGRPPVFPHAGLGRIIACEETDDGRYLIVVRGVARVELGPELPPVRSYREVIATLLPDAPAPADAVAVAHGQLLALCERLCQALDRGADEVRALLASCSCPGACADAIAAALVFDHDERQALLERLDPAERLDRVADHVGRLLCELVPCRGDAN